MFTDPFGGFYYASAVEPSTISKSNKRFDSTRNSFSNTIAMSYSSSLFRFTLLSSSGTDIAQK